MYDIYYAESEGGMILHSKINISQERQMKWCEAQALDRLDSYHKVTLSDGNITIKASAVFFLNGLIWDSILSGYDTFRDIARHKGKYCRLPKCQKFHYLRNVE